MCCYGFSCTSSIVSVSSLLKNEHNSETTSMNKPTTIPLVSEFFVAILLLLVHRTSCFTSFGMGRKFFLFAVYQGKYPEVAT